MLLSYYAPSIPRLAVKPSPRPQVPIPSLSIPRPVNSVPKPKAEIPINPSEVPTPHTLHNPATAGPQSSGRVKAKQPNDPHRFDAQTVNDYAITLRSRPATIDIRSNPVRTLPTRNQAPEYDIEYAKCQARSPKPDTVSTISIIFLDGRLQTYAFCRQTGFGAHTLICLQLPGEPSGRQRLQQTLELELWSTP